MGVFLIVLGSILVLNFFPLLGVLFAAASNERHPWETFFEVWRVQAVVLAVAGFIALIFFLFAQGSELISNQPEVY